MGTLKFCYQLCRSNILILLFARLCFWMFSSAGVVSAALRIVFICIFSVGSCKRDSSEELRKDILHAVFSDICKIVCT